MIIQCLEELRKRDGLTDRQMADKLGFHRVSWLRIKRTGVFGTRFLRAAARVYPEMGKEIGLFLAGDVIPCNIEQSAASSSGRIIGRE
jgi:transcriptional regulator with XRE-family HTH domain